jgi:predicted ATPase/DNA-binding XRE family transcriptional regulator
MDETTTSFGYWVRRQRRALDLTQRALAECVGCAVATIKKIEADERRPSAQMAERLAGCLAIPDDRRARFLLVAQQERAVDTLPLAAAPILAPAALPLAAPLRPATSFVGRASELRTIEARLLEENCRLLTLTGLGGVGKTRLALEAAAALAPAYADGVCVVVPLAGAEDAAGVAAAVLRRLGLPPVGGDANGHLLRALRRRHLLLLLDTVEHLARDAGVLALLSELLAAAPGVALLVTSRERLNLQEEWVLPLEGLPPDEAAIALFTERARQAGGDVPLDGATVAEICRLVEGLPLAVELAAGWAQFLTPAQIAAQLRAGLPPLPARMRNIPERHRSLQALFDQSWALLPEPRRAIFMRLAVLRGSFASDAALAIAGADLPALLELVDASLVRAEGGDRYDLHALARHYAAAQLAVSGLAQEAQRAHAGYYLALAGRDAGQDAIEREYDNIRAAWLWALGAGEWAALWPAAEPLFDYWMNRGSWDDGRNLLLRAVQAALPADTRGYAVALVALATLLARTGHAAEAQPYAEEGHRRALQTGDPNTIALAEMHGGLLAADHAARERHFLAALAAGRQAQNRPLLARTLMLYGDFLRDAGALAQAQAAYDESLALARALGDHALAIYPLGNLGRLALLDGALERARTLFAESVALARARHAPIALADWLLRLGVAQIYAQTPALAAATLAECVRLTEELNHWRNLPNAQIWLAVAALQSGDVAAADAILPLALAEYEKRLHDPESLAPPTELAEALLALALHHAAGARFAEAAGALGCAETLNAVPDPFLAAMAAELRAKLTSALGDAAFAQALAQGRATPVGALLAASARAKTV